MSELTSDDDEETVNLATIIFSSCALLLGFKRKDVIRCGFKATCSLVNTGLMPHCLSVCPWTIGQTDNGRQMEFDTISLTFIDQSGTRLRDDGLSGPE